MFTDTDILEKKCSHGKGRLFDLLLTYIISVVELWLVVIEHHKKFTAVVVRLNIPCNPVLHINVNQAWKSTFFFGYFSFYRSTQYEWVDRHTKGCVATVVLINHKHD